MIYFDVKSVGDLIKEFLAYHKGAGYLADIKVINAWPMVVGTFIAKHTIDLAVRNRILYVRVDSDALRNELNYSRSLLLKNLNDKAGAVVIDEIVLS